MRLRRRWAPPTTARATTSPRWRTTASSEGSLGVEDGYRQTPDAEARLLLVEVFGGGPRLLQRRAELVTQLVESLERLCGASAGDSGPPAVMAQGAVGGMLSVLHTRTIAELSEPLTDLLDDLTELLLVFCAGPPAREARSDCGLRPRLKRRLSIGPPPLSTVRLADWRP